MLPIDLRTEYLHHPLGMDERQPRLSWKVDGEGSARQVSYEVEVRDTETDSSVWSPGAVAGDETCVTYAGAALHAHGSYEWRVRLCDENGAWGRWRSGRFETGLLGEAWPAHWITGTGLGSVQGPVSRFRREFVLSRTPSRARLYVSSLGVYCPWCNGQRVTEHTLMPGYTAYQHRTQYQSYDVTGLLHAGANVLGIEVADGWYKGWIYRHWNSGRVVWGDRCGLICWLRLEYSDGIVQGICTDGGWEFSDGGPYRQSDIYQGETYDARLRQDGWNRIGFKGSGWVHAECFAPRLASGPESTCLSVSHSGHGELVWQSGLPVSRMEILGVRWIKEQSPGVFICDFGQNLTGRERLRVHGSCDRKIVVRHGEMLKEDGGLYTANLRQARATTVIYCDGSEFEYEPEFTYYGFRYLEVTGWEGPLTAADVEAVVIHSELTRTGNFTCSSHLLNQLYSNVVWGNRDNYLDIPTDCPQRDERMGWTGDTQVFMGTAAYNFDISAFFTKWLDDLEASQLDNGVYPMVAPYFPRPGVGKQTADPGWADAGIICPWIMYQVYGDRRVLERHYDSMRRYVRNLEEDSEDYIRDGKIFGDWLNVDCPTSTSLICTAFFAHSADLLSRIAKVLGKKKDERELKTLFNRIRSAYVKRFFPDGKTLSEQTQTAALLSLAFDLVPEAGEKGTVAWLVKDIVETHGTHLSTGFLGTPLLAEVLTRYGHVDVAYALVEQTTYPGWLYSVTQGATTVWERWNSWTREGGFGNATMNSFNHYAYGAVVSWFYGTILGIRPLPDSPGYRRFALCPRPGGSLCHARGWYDSPAGRIESGWRRLENGGIRYEFTVPANCEAVLNLAGQGERCLGAGTHIIDV